MSGSQYSRQKADDFTRLFILGGKGNTEDEFRECFEKYGTVKDIWIVKDRNTNQDKGIVYVSMSKPSEAALAKEELNGRLMPNNPKPIKVLFASTRTEGSVRDPKEDEKMLRIFVVVPKSFEESDIEKVFKEYGDIDYIRIIKDRTTNKSKGLAYVRFYRAYCAALAMENCSPEYKAVFADTKSRSEGPSQRDRWSDSGRHGDYAVRDRASENSSYRGGYSDYREPERRPAPSYREETPMDLLRNYPSAGECRLEALVSGSVSEDMIYRLFDIVPGLEYCNFDRETGMAYLKYSSSQCAAWTKDKFQGFEYPPGYRLMLRYPVAAASIRSGSGYEQSYDFTSDHIGDTMSGLQHSMEVVGSAPVGDNLQALVQSIQKATSVLEKAGLAGNLDGLGSKSSTQRVRYCNMDLPAPKPLVPKETHCEQRLFIVSQPSAFSEHILTDLFSRFGGLIDAYFMPGKNFGYVKYQTKDAAMEAIQTLHGQRIYDMRLKVMEAEPPKYDRSEEGPPSKQQRT